MSKDDIIKETTSEDLFDDCPICQALKKAKEEGREPTMSEMKEAFQKAKEQGAVVGGDWFQNKMKNK